MGLFKKMKKAVTNVVKSPVKAVSSALKGDIMGVANAAVNAATFGTASLTDGSGAFVDGGNVVGQLTGANAIADATNAQTAALNAQYANQAAQEKAAQEALAKQQAEAKSAAISRRRADLSGDTQTIFTSALGDVANSALGKTKKRTVLGG